MSDNELDLDNLLADMEPEEQGGDDVKQPEENSPQLNETNEENKGATSEEENRAPNDKAAERKPVDKRERTANRIEQLLQDRRVAREETTQWMDKHSDLQRESLSLKSEVTTLKQQIVQYDEVIKEVYKQISGEEGTPEDIKSILKGTPKETVQPLNEDDIRKKVLQDIHQEGKLQEKVKKTADTWEKHVKRVQNEFNSSGKAMFQDAFHSFRAKIDKNVSMIDTLEYIGTLEFAPETLYAITQDKVFASASSAFEQVSRINTINAQIMSKKAKVTKSESLPSGGGKAAAKQSRETESFAEFRKRKNGG